MSTTPDTLLDVPTTVLDFTREAEVLGTQGHTVAITLPSGVVLDLWVYDHPDTTSVDVRVRRTLADVNGQDVVPVRKVIGPDALNGTVAVVAR
jgi:hypothetical protein